MLWPPLRDMRIIHLPSLCHTTKSTLPAAAHLAEEQHRGARHGARRQQALGHAGGLGKVVGQRLGAADLQGSREVGIASCLDWKVCKADEAQSPASALALPT